MAQANPLSDQLFVLSGGVLLVSGLLLGFWLFVRWWQQQQARRQRLAGLGYTPQAQTPAGLLARVAAVYGRQGDHPFRLDDLFHRPLAEGDVYLFDLVDKTEAENPLVADVLAAVSPDLDLPRFWLEPRPNGGRLPGVGRRLGRRASVTQGRGEGFSRLEFDEMPAFEERYRVWAEAEAATRRFLTPALREQLTDLKRPYYIAAAGETFIIARPRSAKAPRSNDRATLDEAARLADAETLLALFRDHGSGIQER